MKKLPQIFENNRRWAAGITQADPDFFTKLAEEQTPEILWIGCSDSRVPAEQIAGVVPGDLFVHRNVGNLVIHADMNFLSVLQYAVDILKVKDVIVCGHHGCGGIRAALESKPHGLIDNWLRHVRDTYRRRKSELEHFQSKEEMLDRLCELNVVDQVINVGNTTIVQEAWSRGQTVNLHGWLYDVHDGLLRDLNVCVSSLDDLRALEAR